MCVETFTMQSKSYFEKRQSKSMILETMIIKQCNVSRKRKYLIKLLKLREFHWEIVLLKRLMWLFVLSRNWRSETVEASNSKHKLSKNWNWDCQFQKLISKVKLLILKLKLSHGKFNESRKSLKLNNNIGLIHSKNGQWEKDITNHSALHFISKNCVSETIQFYVNGSALVWFSLVSLAQS